MSREGVKRTFSKAKEHEDYYWENGFCVFTERFLAKKKQCCGSGCRHCPYLPKHGAGSLTLDPEVLKKL
ncbi:MAG: DUF5522 domain-containing protein [Bacteroidia bacterium]|jgi:hypothetical protein|nr:DUF5522 domain-containing protein [Bacteroidia bacterium]